MYIVHVFVKYTLGLNLTKGVENRSARSKTPDKYFIIRDFNKNFRNVKFEDEMFQTYILIAESVMLQLIIQFYILFPLIRKYLIMDIYLFVILHLNGCFNL